MNTIDHHRLDIWLIEGVLSEAEVWELLRSLLPLIQRIHQTGQAVTNLQPEIINRTAEGKFELNLQTIPTSSEYAAPEQLIGQPLPSSDLYSLGIICIQALTGIAPFELWDATADQWNWEVYLHEDISSQLRSVLNKMVERAVEWRYSSVGAILTELGWSNLATVPKNDVQWTCIGTLQGHRQAVTNLVCNWTTNRLYSSSDDKSIGIWDLHTGRLVEKFLHHQRAVTSLALTSHGQFLAAASDDRTISIWNLSQHRLFQILEGHKQAVKSIQFTPDGTTLISASWDKSIQFWDWRSGKHLLTLTGHRLKIAAIALSPKGHLLASGSHDRTARIWDNSTGRTLHILEGHEWAVTAVAFSPDGKFLATGSDDKTIKIWNVVTGQLLTSLPGHAWDTGCLQWLNPQQLMSGSWNPAIKIWDLPSGQAQTVKVHDDFITSILVNDGVAITGSHDRRIRLWNIHS